MKKYVDISGFNIKQANRGNAALSFGAIEFLKKKGLLHEGQDLIKFYVYRNILKFKNNFPHKETFQIYDSVYTEYHVPVFFIEKFLLDIFRIVLPFTYFGRFVKNVAFEAADYGGDGFSDIYGDEHFFARMDQTSLLSKVGVPLIMLPMTVGPFKKKENLEKAKEILHYASRVYVRDNRFVDELKKMNVSFELEKDLSYYMKPQEWNIEIIPNSIGINVSGLAYSNAFPGLEGQFENYPTLINRIIDHFRSKSAHIYLIPHSYNFNKPEENNDDYEACKSVYSRLTNKNGVTFVDRDLSSPEVKYVISKMSFFIGTRMHANFAAIFTNTPVFGLAYSYKFEGAFASNGLDPKKQTYMINNLSSESINEVIDRIDTFYSKSIKKNHNNMKD